MWACSFPVLKLFARETSPLGAAGVMLYFLSVVAILIPLFLRPGLGRIEIAAWSLVITSLGQQHRSGFAFRAGLSLIRNLQQHG